jgi:hypothetical protein
MEMGTPGQPVSLLGQVLSTVLFTLGVAGGSAVVLPDLLRGAVSERWPAATGEIVGWQRLSPPRVHYRYTVGKQVFVGDRVAFGWNEGTGLEAHAERLMARYPAGLAVEIRHHPERPDEAVLVPGVRSEIGAAFAMLACFAVFWTMMAISLVQRLFRVKEPLFGVMTSDTDGDGYSFEPVATRKGKAAHVSRSLWDSASSPRPGTGRAARDGRE